MNVAMCACALIFTVVLMSGCNVQVSVPSADAAMGVQPVGDSVGGLDQSSEIQNQLMHSYSHDSMSDFILTNSGHQRAGY